MSIKAIEQARLDAQKHLDSLKTGQERNRLGQFATPPKLSLEIARYCHRLHPKSEPVRFLDPAIGTGSFYSALLNVVPASQIEKATGIEIDSEFANQSRALWKGTGLTVYNADFAAKKPPKSKRYNFILTNPPYVRHHHLEGRAKAELKRRAERIIERPVSGLAGLYCYFVFLCHEWMEDGGLAAWLIPSEFMDVNYGAALKGYFLNHVSLLRVHRYCPSDVQFDDCLVTSAIVIFRKQPPPVNHEVEISFGGSLSKPQESERVHVQKLARARKWSALPHFQREDASGVRLGDFFRIKRGIATGANSFFILPRQQAIEAGVPGQFLKPILPSPRLLTQAVVEGDQQGWPMLDPPLAVLDCSLSEDEVAANHPRLWEYLQHGIETGVAKGYLASRREPWYSQEQRPCAPFLCTYMGRNGKNRQPFRFIWNKSKAIATNVYLLLYPKPVVASAFESDAALCSEVFDVLSAIRAEDLIGEGRVYGGGLHKIEPKELAYLPAGRIAESLRTVVESSTLFGL